MYSLRGYQAGIVDSLCKGHGHFAAWQLPTLVLMSSLVLGTGPAVLGHLPATHTLTLKRCKTVLSHNYYTSRATGSYSSH